jgi:hypothetical protein
LLGAARVEHLIASRAAAVASSTLRASSATSTPAAVAMICSACCSNEIRVSGSAVRRYPRPASFFPQDRWSQASTSSTSWCSSA